MNDKTPASRWHPSIRPFAVRVTQHTLPVHFAVRCVISDVIFRLHNGQRLLDQAENDEMIGAEDIDEGI